MSHNLFAGGKFYVSLQVRECNRLKALIRDGGGEITTREGDAHYLLFDPDQPHKAPEGALDYKIISDSIEHGVFQGKDSYRLESVDPRPVGSLKPARTTRARFTEEEDLAIWNMVKKLESGQIAPSKAEMWKNLERQNPRHTWQSYQDRFNKILKHNPPANARSETRHSTRQPSHKRQQSEDDQLNASNTKKKRTSIEGHQERNESGGFGSQLSAEAQSAAETADEAANSDVRNAKRVSGQREDIAKQNTQLGESMEDTFSLPLPPGGFLETQLQETPGDFDEEQDEDSSAEETQKPFPELVKMFLSQGYNNNEILMAAYSTCAHPHLTAVVLEAVKRGQATPDGVAGVWTSEDDKKLEKSKHDAKLVEFLKDKHGEKLLRVRREFLAAMSAR